MLRIDDILSLRCPDCRGALCYHGAYANVGPGPSAVAGRTQQIEFGALRCADCEAVFSVEDGLPRLYREEAVRGNDRLLRVFYDGAPWLHDPAVRYTLPLFQLSIRETEAQLRAGYAARLELERLQPHADGRPVRILEVGIGTGANLDLVRRALPPGLPVEIWGADLSFGMLSVLRARRRARPEELPRLVMADAHALPFADHFFDRVFHVGALGSYRDPARALAEMARVAVPGSPIVAVDEQLDPARDGNLLARAFFKLVTFYEARPHCPIEALPEGATDVLEEQLSRFFYCLRFRMPGASEAPARREASA